MLDPIIPLFKHKLFTIISSNKFEQPDKGDKDVYDVIILNLTEYNKSFLKSNFTLSSDDIRKSTSSGTIII